MNYTINFETREILVTKKFSNAAQRKGSCEYEEMISLIKDLPNYEIRVKQIQKSYNRNTYKGLTIAAMENYIRNNDENSLKTFEAVQSVFSYGEGKYFKIREWFLKKYGKDVDYFPVA